MSALWNRGSHADKLDSVIHKLATDLDIDRSVIRDVVWLELEKIHAARVAVHEITLSNIELNLSALRTKEHTLTQTITKKEQLLRDMKVKVLQLSGDLEAKKSMVAEETDRLSVAQTKLAEVQVALHEIHKKRQQAEYDLIMTTHSRTEKTDSSARLFRILLFCIGIAGALIATFFIKRQ